MSFGFLTESALLPAKSKPIQVDGRSLVDLKAVVYAKEQKVKQAGAGGSSVAGSLRGLRGKRGAAAAEASTAARKDVFARSNRGVEERSKGDDLERITASKKQQAVERTLAAKSKLYEKMAKGEIGSSTTSSLVDFSRKTGSDLALLEAKASKPKRRRGREDVGSGGTGARDKSGGRVGKGKWPRGEDGDVRRHETSRDTDEGDGEGEEEEDDPTSAEVSIIDEFGRDRKVPRGSELHQAYLEARKAQAEAKADSEAYDERYSYRGNKGTAPRSAASGDDAGAWAWSSGHGRGADGGDFETREGQDKKAEKDVEELLRREKEDGSKDPGAAKILSQWERTLTGDQKEYLREVQAEVEASRSNHQASRKRQRQDRRELIRQKQHARVAAKSAPTSTRDVGAAAAETAGDRDRNGALSSFLRTT